MPAASVVRSSGLVGPAGRPNANSVRVDSDTDTLKFGTGQSGTTEKEAMDLSSSQTVTGVKTGGTYASPTITGPTISDPTISGTVTDSSVKNGPAPVNTTAATLAIAAATHAGKLVTINKADGITVTLPAATGTGNRYRFQVGTAVASSQIRFNVTGNDSMAGIAYMHDEDTAAVSGFRASGDADQMDLNGGTKGGQVGDIVEFEDVAADKWSVLAFLSVVAGSNPATPFATGQVS